MFNKEAEEYREKGKREGYYLVSQEMDQEELDYIIDETFKDAAEFGYNKANEWHDLRKNPNDLPNVMDEVLVCYKNGYIDTWLYFKDFKHEAVIGWKYLPKPLN